MEDYLRTASKVSSLHRQRILAHVAARSACSLEDLFRATDGEVTRDEIYSLIAAGDIFVDLLSALLPEPEKVTVWLEKPLQPDRMNAGPSSATVRRSGREKRWTGTAKAGLLLIPASAPSVCWRRTGRSSRFHWTQFAECVRQNRIRVLSHSGRESKSPQIQTRLLQASEADLADATRRFQLVSRALRGESPDAVPSRTLRRWKASYLAAQDEHGSGYLGLLPRPNTGNPADRLPEKTRSLMIEFIEKNYETVKQKTMYAAWAALKLACDRQQIAAPSFKTFTVLVHQRAGAEQTLKRRGSRAAYQQQPFYWELEQRTPRHGDRPFEIGHIDHTQADVWAVCSQTGRILGRPWISFLTDAFSRRILALHLTFDPPSYRSCMMILRECVRRHSRLPQILVLDGGSEFESTYFEALLARCEVTKKSRPPARGNSSGGCLPK